MRWPVMDEVTCDGGKTQVVAATKVLRLGQKRFLLIRPVSWCLSVDLEKKQRKE